MSKRDSVPGDVWWVSTDGLILDTVKVTAKGEIEEHGLPNKSTVTVVGEVWDDNPDDHVYYIITAKGHQQMTRGRLEAMLKNGHLMPFKLNYAAPPAR